MEYGQDLLGATRGSAGQGLVIVDNASDEFAGDEIRRREVNAFLLSLREIARGTDFSVLLLAHVDRDASRVRKAEG